MKIDTDLRLALKSACNSQPHSSYNAHVQEHKDQIAFLLARRPLLKANLSKAKRTMAKAEADSLAARQVFSDLGISTDLDNIRDDAKFLKAGGHSPRPSKSRWTYDTVMAEIAAAEPKELKAILKKYGIKWV